MIKVQKFSNMLLRKYVWSGKSYQFCFPILIYGRVSVERNAFAILIQTFTKWHEIYPESDNWKVYSTREQCDSVDLSGGIRKNGARYLCQNFACGVVRRILC